MLHLQLGVTFLDEKGNLPEGITTWQFNFKFNLTEDMYAEDSVDLLQVWSLEPFFSRFLPAAAGQVLFDFVLEKIPFALRNLELHGQSSLRRSLLGWAIVGCGKSKGKGRGIVTLSGCLHQNSGIQFEKHEQEGIDPMLFAEMMLMSGLVLMPQVITISITYY